MKPTAYDVDLAMAMALEASIPMLRLRFLDCGHGWVLEAMDESADLQETAGLLNPTRHTLTRLISELEILASSNKNFQMFCVPDCSDMVQQGWSSAPFHKTSEIARRHIMIHDVRVPFRLPATRLRETGGRCQEDINRRAAGDSGPEDGD